MIRVSDLTVAINGDTICKPPPIELAEGQRLQLVGPNGSGKTTFLRVLAGLTQPTSGVCEIDAAPRDRVYVHQSPLLFRGGVRFNVMYGLASAGVPRHQRVELAHDWLRRLGGDYLLGRSCRGLSGGERRRVALARAFALEPKLLLLDEPFSDLDDEGAALVVDAIAGLHDSTVIVATPSGEATTYRQVEMTRATNQ